MSKATQLSDFWNGWHRSRQIAPERVEVRQAVFREHFIGADEGETGSYTHEPVAALLGALRLEWGRK